MLLCYIFASISFILYGIIYIPMAIEIVTNHVVELTGTMGSGKSLAGTVLRESGIPVEDIDEIADYVKSPGQPAYEDIIKTWPGVLGPDGKINKPILRSLTFGKKDQGAIRELQDITHPRIHTELLQRLSRPIDSPYIAYERPALKQPSAIKPDHRLAVIRKFDINRQVKVVVERGRLNGQYITHGEAAEMIARQHTIESLSAIAHSIIKNNCPKPRFEKKVTRWNEDYLDKLKKPTASVD